MKKVISIIIAAVVFGAVLCPAFASAEAVPTSYSIKNMTARFTPGDGAVGTIAIEADAEGIAAGEYINVSIYVSVGDISDVPGGAAEPLTFRLFKAENCVSGGRLAVSVNGSVEKLLGKCAVCVQIPNRGENNDWVCAYLEAPLTAASGEDGETKTIWAPAGFAAEEWLNANGAELFERDSMKISGWKNADGSPLGDAAIPLTGLSVEAQWEPENGYLLGDLDFDGVHTVSDALAALRIAVRLQEPGELDMRVGDVDFDGEINVADALAILRIAAKLAEPFDIYV
ncbi:MAG: dockerin type I repeat-containing protein [Clostridia bacterium]|nr:dockerin type I repeat-containing protein [Clostridia bacterium]